MPECFPSDVISWSKFGQRCPCGSRIDECTLIVKKSLFRHHMGMSETELMTFYKGCPELNVTSQAKQPDVEQEDDMERVDSEEQPYSK